MHIHDNLSILSRNLKNELVSADYTSRGGEKQCHMCRRGQDPKRSRTKLTCRQVNIGIPKIHPRCLFSHKDRHLMSIILAFRCPFSQ